MLLLEPDPVRFFAQEDEKEKIGGFGRFLKRVSYPIRRLFLPKPYS